MIGKMIKKYVNASKKNNKIHKNVCWDKNY